MATEKPSHSDIVVPVLGMHRSGTSMFTRIINLMGVELGNPLLPAGPANTLGYWENQYFLDIDMKALVHLNCHEHGFAPEDRLLEVAKASSKLVAPPALSQHVEQYIETHFQHGIWGWKDPRTVLLMPFWENLLASLGYHQLRPMIIIRGPGPCVRSMSKTGYVDQAAQRWGLSVAELSLEAWKAYNRILSEMQRRTGCYMGLYDWFLDQDSAAEEIDRCAAYLGLNKIPKQEILSWIKRDKPPHDSDLHPGDTAADQLYAELVRQAEHSR